MNLHTDKTHTKKYTDFSLKKAEYFNRTLTIFAISLILLPIHPSLQYYFFSRDISSALVSAFLAIPIFYVAAAKRLYTNRILFIFLLFYAYIAWMLFRSIASPAIELPNWLDSSKGLLVLLPLALLAALVASKEQRWAAITIITLGALAVIHYQYLLVSGAFSETVGFRSLSPYMEKQNYQSTSFYFGFAGLAMIVLFIRGRKINAAVGLVGLFFLITLMSTVGARSSILALIVTFFIITLLSGSIKIVRLIFVFAAVGPILATGAWMLGFFDAQDIQNKFIVVTRFATLAEGGDSSHRIRLFSAAVNLWLDSPSNFIFGAGLGTFPQFIGATEDGWYPHNFVLESLAEGGLIAGILLFDIGRRFFSKLTVLSTKTVNIEQVYLGAAAIYATLAYQFMGSIQTIWFPAFFVTLFLFSKPDQTL